MCAKFKTAVSLIPRDVRSVIYSLAVSGSVMSLMLITLFYVVRPSSEAMVFSPCGLEPYAPVNDCEDAVEASWVEESEEERLTLLARAIDKAVPKGSYAERVAVGAVLLNRESNESFPSSLSAVIKGAGLYPDDTEVKISERTLHAASDALLGVDPTLGAVYIMRTDDTRYPEFKARVTAIYGNFAFVK